MQPRTLWDNVFHIIYGYDVLFKCVMIVHGGCTAFNLHYNYYNRTQVPKRLSLQLISDFKIMLKKRRGKKEKNARKLQQHIKVRQCVRKCGCILPSYMWSITTLALIWWRPAWRSNVMQNEPFFSIWTNFSFSFDEIANYFLFLAHQKVDFDWN